VKRALIVGSAGQDGTYLSEQLAAQGVEVRGVDRDTTPRCDLFDPVAVRALVADFRPDGVFFLPAYHHSSEDAHEALGDELLKSQALHVTAWIHLLEALVATCPEAHAFYAASSHVFGEPPTPTQDEDTPFAPRTPYAVTKAAGVEVGRLYRARGLRVSSGILFNHESPRRPLRFVSQRIAHGAVAAARAVARGEPYTLELGSLSAVVDWGWAPDYTDAMARIVRLDTPGDFVIATGQPHTPADLCRVAFEAVGLDWTKHVVERPGRVTRQVPPLVGNAMRLRRTTGWSPAVSFEAMVQMLVAAARTTGNES
jgi:GDPmannose 4,6-dehydratase